jgi:glycerol-3-phosphate dehydrogenase
VRQEDNRSEAAVRMGMRNKYDVLIVGGGVIGTAIAARLSQTSARVCLVEKAGDVAEGASKGNAGITSSYYAAPGTLEAKLTTDSVFRWDEVCRKLNVPFRRIGALMPALDEVEAQALSKEMELALQCGVRAEILSGEEARRREPMISPKCLNALHLPDEGIIDPMRLTWALAELAARNGAELLFDSPVIGFTKNNSRLAAALTPRETIEADFFVDAAGLHADVISRLAGGDSFRMWARKGQYWILDREFGARLHHIIFSAPLVETKGIHVVPTTRGSVLIGPTAEDIEDRDDKSTSREMLDHALKSARRLVPSLNLEHIIKAYAALRPASDTPFFVRLDGQIPNLIHCVSRSIGISTSLGIADYAFDLLRDAGLSVSERADASDELPSVPNLRHAEQPEMLTDLAAGYSQVICVCEQVTAREIEAALTSQVPARSVDGVWKRTGAAGGRCQGSLCLSGILFMCSVHMNCPPEFVPIKDNATVGVGRANET